MAYRLRRVDVLGLAYSSQRCGWMNPMSDGGADRRAYAGCKTSSGKMQALYLESAWPPRAMIMEESQA